MMFREYPPFQSHSVFFSPDQNFLCMVGTKFYFSIIQPCQERTQNNSQIMLNSPMLVLDDVLFCHISSGTEAFSVEIIIISAKGQ